jgi:hypothetical protein
MKNDVLLNFLVLAPLLAGALGMGLMLAAWSRALETPHHVRIFFIEPHPVRRFVRWLAEVAGTGIFVAALALALAMTVAAMAQPR